MTKFERELNGEFGIGAQRNAESSLAYMKESLQNKEIRFYKGIARWKLSKHCLPQDCAECLSLLTDKIDIVATQKARDKELHSFAVAYRKQMKNYQPSEEELFEMRSAFGEGTKVVNVITGQITQL